MKVKAITTGILVSLSLLMLVALVALFPVYSTGVKVFSIAGTLLMVLMTVCEVYDLNRILRESRQEKSLDKNKYPECANCLEDCRTCPIMFEYLVHLDGEDER